MVTKTRKQRGGCGCQQSHLYNNEATQVEAFNSSVYRTTGGGRKTKNNKYSVFDNYVNGLIRGGASGKKIIRSVQQILREKKDHKKSAALLNDYARRHGKKNKQRRSRKMRGGADTDTTTTTSALVTLNQTDYPTTNPYYDDVAGYRGNAGDSNMLTGSTAPPSLYQSFLKWFQGESTIFTPSYSDPLNNTGLQLNCQGNSCNSLDVKYPYPTDSKPVSTGNIVTLDSVPVDSDLYYQLYPSYSSTTNYAPAPRLLPEMQRA